MASTILNFLLLLLSFFSVRVSAHSIVAPNLQTSAQFAPAADANEAASLRFEPDLLEWWGPVKDGEPNVTLWVSDLKDLWLQVRHLNPNWVGAVPDPREIIGNDGLRLCSNDAHIATGDFDDARRWVQLLRGLEGYWTIGPSRCHRLGCGPNTGLYWCNDNEFGIRTSAKALYARGAHILDNCCRRSDGAARKHEPIAGVELFPDSETEAAHIRVILGYGTCYDPVWVSPFSYSFPGKYGSCPT